MRRVRKESVGLRQWAGLALTGLVGLRVGLMGLYTFTYQNLLFVGSL